MTIVTITEVLDDLRAADEVTRRFERRYWLSSADFFNLYQNGDLDNGEHAEDFAMWAGFYQIKLDRETALETLSRKRLHQLRNRRSKGSSIAIDPREPALTA
ncbi:MAG: hypothetical protein GY796_30085 [Chloroflexi bacterium]|nr:hypothetical protein [Chloroflexota bacterium]